MSTPFEDKIDSEIAAKEATPFESLIDREINLKEHGTLPQQALTAIEGAGKGFLGPLFTGAENVLYKMGFKEFSPEHQEARKEASPIIHGVSEFGTLIGGGISGRGLGGALGKIGEAAQAGIEGANTASRIAKAGNEIATVVPPSYIAKIGSSALRGAIENGLYRAQDEASKLINDVSGGAASALTNVGLSSALGGALLGGASSVSAFWKKTAGTKLGQALSTISNKLGGIEGSSSIVDDLSLKSGIEVPPEIKAGMEGDHWVQNQLNLLREVKKPEVLESFDKIESQGQERLIGFTGKTAAEATSHSEAKQGRLGLDQFHEEIKNKMAPFEKRFGEINNRIENLDLPKEETIRTEIPSKNSTYYDNAPSEVEITKIPGAKEILADKIAKAAFDAGYDATLPNQYNVINSTLGQINKATTIKSLSNIATHINNITSHDSSLWHIGGVLRDAVREGQNDLIHEMLGKHAPELIDNMIKARQDYGAFSNLLKELNTHLNLGKYGGPEGFLAKLEEKLTPEKFLKKLTPYGNAEILPFMAHNFPKTLEKIREFETLDFLKPAVLKAPKGQEISIKTFMNDYEKLSPEVRDFIFTKEAQQGIESTGALLEMIPAYKSSATGGWINNLFSQVPALGTALAMHLLGHSAVGGYAIGHVLKYLGRDLPDSARLMLLKWLGSSKPIDAPGFKAGFELMNETIRGENVIKGAAKAVFEGGMKVIPEHILIDDKELKKLDEKLKEIDKNPDALEKMGDSTSYYMPDHGFTITSMVTQAAQYVNQNRPKSIQLGPLDKEIEPNRLQKAEFKRLLEIAEQPLMVLNLLKRGTLTTKDMMHLTSMYPSVYENYKMKVLNEMADYSSKGKKIPHQLKMGLSVFFGQPMDSSLNMNSIQTNQIAMQRAIAEEQAQKQPHPSQAGLSKLKQASRLSLEPSDTGT